MKQHVYVQGIINTKVEVDPILVFEKIKENIVSFGKFVREKSDGTLMVMYDEGNFEVESHQISRIEYDLFLSMKNAINFYEKYINEQALNKN